MIEVRFAPIAVWPYPATPDYARRSRHTFKAGWANTLALLDTELRQIDGKDVTVGGGWREQDIRLDGMPRSGAREPAHPGVEVSFTAYVGGSRKRLVYATDVCERWEHNVRSIALGLESLRAVDRYGITRYGEQYAGFKQLSSGGPDPQRGAALIREHGSVVAALKATHPDQGGDRQDFADVQAAREAGAT